MRRGSTLVVLALVVAGCTTQADRSSTTSQRTEVGSDPKALLRSPSGLDFSLVGATPEDFEEACSRSGGKFESFVFQGGAVCHMDSDHWWGRPTSMGRFSS